MLQGDSKVSLGRINLNKENYEPKKTLDRIHRGLRFHLSV
jgi:hypothetical protein